MFLLFQKLVNPDPEKRPAALSLLHHPVLVPFAEKSRAQLRRELNTEKFRNELLTKQLEEAAKCLNSSYQNPKPSKDLPPTITSNATKFSRSRSVTFF